MTLTNYSRKCQLLAKTELEKVKYCAYYYRTFEQLEEFNVQQAEEWLTVKLGFAAPNRTRLKARLKKSLDFVKGRNYDHFRLSAKTLERLSTELEIVSATEEIDTTNSILPESLYSGTRGFIERLAQQVNASFEHNLCDGCAVLMRRLLEVSLILAYQHNNIEILIQNEDKSYKMLDAIIGDAENNSVLALSRDARATLRDFKDLGNFSAHKIYYICRKSEIEQVRRKYRATIEEIFYKSGLQR